MFLLSLPMRERGLKYMWYLTDVPDIESLPMRERGLKYRTDGPGMAGC